MTGDGMGFLEYLRFAGSLGAVLALILGGMWLLRRFGLAGLAMRPPARRRLKLVEVLPLDPKRRLLLVQCDDRQHLLLIGGITDLVVDHNVARPPGGGDADKER